MGYAVIKLFKKEDIINMSNEVVKAPKFSVAIQDQKYVELINDTIGDPATAKRFVAEISSVVGNNYTLQGCTTISIISGGLLAQTLNLPLSSSLGFCYLVPYQSGKFKVAQFQIGWKGIVQLALRSGQYERLGVRIVHKGEYAGQDEFGEDIMKFNHEFDNAEPIGVFAYMQLTSGFKKTLYWTMEQCEAHGTKYSKAHSGTNKGGEFDNWAKNFEAMACKTVLKQLISKYGIMSVDLQNAIVKDQAVIDGNTVNYVDNPATADNVKAKEQEVKTDSNGEVIKDIAVDEEKPTSVEPPKDVSMDPDDFPF